MFLVVSVALLAASCDAYLNRQPDDQLTSDNIFEKQSSTFSYLVNCYYYLPNLSNAPYAIETCGSDEASSAYQGSGRCWALMTHGLLSPNTGEEYYRDVYQKAWYGIHECTYFIHNVGRCPELTAEEANVWKSEARFLRAYYYTWLMIRYGPVICVKDELPDYLDAKINYYDRMPWDETVEWLVSEFNAAAENLPADWGASYQGRATKGAALAIKARLLLYSARPLFNGQDGTGLYDNMKNHDGQLIFATQYDENKWKKAADAAREVIDLGQFALVGDGVINASSSMKDVIKNYHSIFTAMTSEELIWGRNLIASLWRQPATPRAMGNTNGWGGFGPTQKLVDFFAMSNGYYPIRNIEEEDYENGLGVPDIDARSGYDESGSASFVNPFWQYIPAAKAITTAVPTRNMYIGREARFYANVEWSGQPFVCNVTSVTTQYFHGGAHGCGVGQNWPSTGYTPLKFIDTEKLGTNTDYGNFFWPEIRYADILLMYAEALNEYNSADENILKYWNLVRKRAGLKDIEQLYPEIKGDKGLQRKFLRRERMVELCFENSRYLDCNSWMISVKENNGAVVGCNIGADSDAMNSNYWTRTSIFGPGRYGEAGFNTPRVFESKMYLLPFNQGELDRSYNLTQNYGW